MLIIVKYFDEARRQVITAQNWLRKRADTDVERNDE